MSIGNVGASGSIEHWLLRDQGAAAGEGFSLADTPFRCLGVDPPSGRSASATCIGSPWAGAISAFHPELIDSFMEIVEQLRELAALDEAGLLADRVAHLDGISASLRPAS
jgi:hypothetical protein